MVIDSLCEISRSTKIMIDGDRKSVVWINSSWIDDEGNLRPKYHGLVAGKLESKQKKDTRMNFMHPRSYAM